MKPTEFITEANVKAKILKDPRLTKMLAIAMRHDETLPKGLIARLGPKPTDSELIQLYSDLLDKTLSNTEYGNLSSDSKFDDWLTRLYANNVLNYEEINGEAGDILGAWKALSVRNLLEPNHQDFNKFTSLVAIQRLLRREQYQQLLNKIKNAAMIEKHKRERAEAVLIDNERYFVVIPYNYGACYTFSNAEGVNAQFCTGSSNGLYWFDRYSKDGPVICVFDKSNPNDVNGKWQIHAATNQIVNAYQENRYAVTLNSKKFGELFPGLMKAITASMSANAGAIQEGSTNLVRGGYNVSKDIADLKSSFPEAFTSAPAQQYTSYEEWSAAAVKLNGELFDDNSEFRNISGIETVSINGTTWAKWDNAAQLGKIDVDKAKELAKGLAPAPAEPAQQGYYRVTYRISGAHVDIPANTEAEARAAIEREYANTSIALDQLDYERINPNDAVVNETPDTSGPIGVQPGGWKTYSPKPAGKVTEGDVVPMKKKKTEYDKYKDAFSKQHNDEHRHGVGYIECDYCGDVNCDYDCDGSQADGELEEDTAYAGGMGQGGNAGESYRKFKPKVAGSVTDEAANPAQQAAIAINMKKHHKKPKSVSEEWSQKYKNSINCSHPKGFSQKAHCAGKKKRNESIEMEMTCPDCGMCKTHGDYSKDNLDEACWKGYHKEGNKKMFGKTVPNCVKNESVAESSEQQYAVTIDAIDHGVLAPVTVVASSPEEAKQKAIASVKASMITRGYELMVRSVSAKPKQGVTGNDYQDFKSRERNAGLEKDPPHEISRTYFKIPFDQAKEIKGMYSLRWDPMKKLWFKPKYNTSGRTHDFHIQQLEKQFPIVKDVSESKCPKCGGPAFSEETIAEAKDACYYKVKSRYKVWPSAYASGALVKCRKVGASNWGNKNESTDLDQLDENLHQWFKEKWVRFGPDGKIRGDCARGEDSEGKPKCLPQSKAHALGKKGRKYAAAKKRREDPNPERRGKAKNVATKKKTKESSIMKGIVREAPAAHHYVLYIDGKPIMKAERGAADLEDYVERLRQKHPGVKVELKYEPVNSPKSVEETSSTGMGGGSAGIGGGSMVGGPTTYEQEYDPFKSKGPQRIRAMTYESTLDEQSEKRRK